MKFQVNMNVMRILLLVTLMSGVCSNSFSQARLVFNNNPYMVMRNGVYLVVANGNPNAISGTGKIVSENEYNKVRWWIGTNTGTYTIPFADNAGSGPGFGDSAQTGDAGTSIPYTLNIITAGTTVLPVSSVYVDFSTYDGSNWDNNTYRPSMVTHMGQFLPPNVANHSAKAIDRFWIVDAQGYSTKPTATMTFTYIDNEWTAVGNTFPAENVLGAQRFNTTLNKWGDMWPLQASINTTTNVVVTTSVSPADFFAAWTLSDINDPLPIELLYFQATCKDNHSVVLEWATASEINNEAFILERSINGTEWISIAQLPGQGSSSVINTYAHTDNVQEFPVYYRLWQKDYNGSFLKIAETSAECKNKEGNTLSIHSVFNQGNSTVLSLSIPEEDEYFIEIFDAAGKLVYVETRYLNNGNTVQSLPVSIASGIYVLRVYSSKYIDTYKFHGSF